MNTKQYKLSWVFESYQDHRQARTVYSWTYTSGWYGRDVHKNRAHQQYFALNNQLSMTGWVLQYLPYTERCGFSPSFSH